MDDKTTKIPSLKEFQKAQQEHEKRAQRNRPADKNRHVKGDTHRVDLTRSKRESSKNLNSDRTKAYRPESRYGAKSKSSLSGSTQKLDINKIRSQTDSERRKTGEKSYERRFQSPRQQSLTQTRVAGQKPPQQRSTQQRQNTQHPTQQRSHHQRPPQPRPSRSSGQHRPVDTHPQVRRKKRKKPLSPFARKVRRIFIYVLIVLAFLLAGLILSLTVLFKTENIVVNVPDNFYSSQDIISASGLHYQDNIFTANKSRAEAKLMEKFPYIKSVDIRAVIPDTINIDIELSTESFAVKTDKLTYIANENSKVLQVISTADEVQVPLIEGVKVSDAKAGQTLTFESDLVKDSLSEMFNFAKEKGYRNITRVDIESQTTVTGTHTLEIRYVYDDRIVVYLGIPENISYKMQTAQTIISEKLDVNNSVLTGELDVSQSYDTKKSYFNQYSLIPEAVITEPSTEPTSEASEGYYY